MRELAAHSRAVGSTPIAKWVQDMLDEMGKLAGLARSVGVDPSKVKFKTRKYGFDSLPPDLSVLRPTKAGLDEAAQRIEDASDMPPEPMPPVFGGKPFPWRPTALGSSRRRMLAGSRGNTLMKRDAASLYPCQTASVVHPCQGLAS